MKPIFLFVGLTLIQTVGCSYALDPSKGDPNAHEYLSSRIEKITKMDTSNCDTSGDSLLLIRFQPPYKTTINFIELGNPIKRRYQAELTFQEIKKTKIIKCDFFDQSDIERDVHLKSLDDSLKYLEAIWSDEKCSSGAKTYLNEIVAEHNDFRVMVSIHSVGDKHEFSISRPGSRIIPPFNCHQINEVLLLNKWGQNTIK